MADWWDRLPSLINAENTAMLRGVRGAIAAAYQDRLDALVLLNPEIGSQDSSQRNWHLVALIKDFEESESRALHEIAEAATARGTCIALLGLPDKRCMIPADLRDRINDVGVPVSASGEMTCTECILWQRDEPDLHELIDGLPVRMSDSRQLTRKCLRISTAATRAFGCWKSGRAWVLAPQSGLGGKAPWEVASEGWRGVVVALRLLEQVCPGCTWYDPDTAELMIDYRSRNLIAEAERFDAIEASRRAE
jgi:hypothetical protein